MENHEEEDFEEQEREEQLEEETHETIKEAEEAVLRRILPRESKENHRYFKDKAGQKTQDVNPSSLKKKKYRRQ